MRKIRVGNIDKYVDDQKSIDSHRLNLKWRDVEPEVEEIEQPKGVRVFFVRLLIWLIARISPFPLTINIGEIKNESKSSTGS